MTGSTFLSILEKESEIIKTANDRIGQLLSNKYAELD